MHKDTVFGEVNLRKVKTVSLNEAIKNPTRIVEKEFKIKLQSLLKQGYDAKKIKKQFHNFTISKNSQRNLRSKIEYLFLYARKRRIKTYNGKTIPNFKVVFLTLKMPSKQIHPSSVIIVECLQPFLDLLRKRLGMRNYVYRVEFQKNGNVHFHIVTDTYIDYYFALKHWNRFLNKLGYIDAFAEKMRALSINEYANRYGNDFQGKKIDFNVIKKRYENGKKSKWRNPNSVDVKNAKSGDNLGLYISKYFSKNENGAKQNELDNEENSFALRLCYWSRSLSQMKPESMPLDYYDVDVFRELAKEENVTICYYDYCTVIYFDYNKLSGLAKDYLKYYFAELRREVGYIPA